MVDGGDSSSGDDVESVPGEALVDGMMMTLWVHFRPPPARSSAEKASEPSGPLNADSAVDDSDGGRPVLDREIPIPARTAAQRREGEWYARWAEIYLESDGPDDLPFVSFEEWMRTGRSEPPATRPAVGPDSVGRDVEFAGVDEEWERELERMLEERREMDVEFDALIRDFDQSRSSEFERPYGWMRMWWWARLFGIEDRMEEYLEERRRSIRIGEPVEGPSEEALFGEPGAPDLDGSQPERLYAIVNFFERIDPAGAVATSPAEYRLIRDFAAGSFGLTREVIRGWFDGRIAVTEEVGEPIEPPTMELVPGEPDTHVPAEPEISRSSHLDPPELEIDAGELEEGDSAVDDHDQTPADDGEEEPSLVVPKLELDPDPRTGADSAVDDSDPVWVMAGPKPAVVDSDRSLDAELDDGEDPPDEARSGRGRRISIGVAAVAAAVIAVIAGFALLGGGDKQPGESVVAEPSAVAASPTAASAIGEAPTAEATFGIAAVAELVVCLGNPEASFSGFQQPDGTYIDAETGEPRGCPGD